MIKIFEINGKKVFIVHGIYSYTQLYGDIVKIRNTDKHLSIPVKFNKILRKIHIQKWRIKCEGFSYMKRKPLYIKYDEWTEFTIVQCPDEHITTIAICHPIEQFSRKEGKLWSGWRMVLALTQPYVDEWWKDVLR